MLHFSSLRRLALTGLVLITGAGTMAACSQDSDALVIYNAQHERLTQELTDAFTEETGIKVELRNGKDFELANQIKAEGDGSPADIFVTENSPAMQVVATEGLFEPIPDDIFAQVPAEFSPSTQEWMGVAARSTVFVYNKDAVSEDELPASILDLTTPEWDGRFGFAPGGADFQAIASAVLALEGPDAGKAWIDGLAQYGEVLNNNIAIMKAVNAGELDGGIIYHYYWYRDQAEAGDNSKNTALHFFGNRDPGAFISVSGIGSLASSDHQEDAQAFLRWITGPTGQALLAESYALEYPLGTGVAPADALTPIADLDPPTVDIAKLNGPEVIELFQSAGLL